MFGFSINGELRMKCSLTQMYLYFSKTQNPFSTEFKSVCVGWLSELSFEYYTTILLLSGKTFVSPTAT